MKYYDDIKSELDRYNSNYSKATGQIGNRITNTDILAQNIAKSIMTSDKSVEHKIYRYQMGKWGSSEAGLLNALDDIVNNGGTIVSVIYIERTNTSDWEGYRVIWR